MDVISKLLPVGHPNRPGKQLEDLWAIIVHYTANERPSATDTANINYIGRAWENGKYWAGTKAVLGPIEKGSIGKGPQGLGLGFSYGSAHIFADHDSMSMAIPTDEVAWHGNFVFCVEGGKSFIPRNFTRSFSHAVRAAGLPPMRFHDMPHSFASMVLDKTGSLKVVQELLGQACFSVTADTYSHLLPRAKKEALGAVSSAVPSWVGKE